MDGVRHLLLQASVSLLRAEWQSELAGLKSELDHKRRQAAAALKAKQEEEDLKVRHERHMWQMSLQPTAIKQAKLLSNKRRNSRHGMKQGGLCSNAYVIGAASTCCPPCKS